MLKQIKCEVSIMSLVRHPYGVEWKEVMANKAKVFLVVEYDKGGELFAKVAKGNMKEDPARKYFQQLNYAADFCHNCGIAI